MIHVLIAEQRYEQMEYCCKLIKQIMPDCILHKTGSTNGANHIITAEQIDVFFISLASPKTGFAFAEKIIKESKAVFPLIVFLADAEMDWEEIHKKYHHYAFLKFPFSTGAFRERMEPLFLKLVSADALDSQRTTEMLILRMGKQIELIKYDDILFAESDQRKIKIVTKEMVYPKIIIKLENFIKIVDNPYFCRCHRGVAINLKNVRRLEPIHSRLHDVIFDNSDHRCPVSSIYCKQIMDEHFKLRKGMNCIKIDMK